MTTNNLIGYDPLAWMDGAEFEDEDTIAVVEPKAPVPAKKSTKSRVKAKVASIETAPEPVAIEPEVIVVDAESNNEITAETVEVDISVDEEGDVEITVETNRNIEMDVEVSVENSDDSVMESIVEEITADVVQEELQAIEEIPVPEEDVAVEQKHIEEAPIDALAEPHIDLESDSTIKNVAQLYGTLKSSLAAHDVIEINAADVTTIDTATLQLLVSLKKDAPNLGKTVDIIYPSERFIESAKLLGLLEILGI